MKYTGKMMAEHELFEWSDAMKNHDGWRFVGMESEGMLRFAHESNDYIWYRGPTDADLWPDRNDPATLRCLIETIKKPGTSFYVSRHRHEYERSWYLCLTLRADGNEYQVSGADEFDATYEAYEIAKAVQDG